MADIDSASPREDSPFWRFSLRFYALPEIGPTCIALQDQAGADVNLLLLLLFLAERHAAVTPEGIAQLDESVRAWREQVVMKLRDVRRALKSGIGPVPLAASEALRAQIKRLELESERIQQHVLEGLGEDAGVSRMFSPEAAAESNIAAYGARLGGFPPHEVAIILSAFAALPRPSI